MDRAAPRTSVTRAIATVLLAILLGVAFGAFANWAMSTAPGFTPGERPRTIGAHTGWQLVHLVSGTWFWTVLTVATAWALTRRSSLDGARRWLWTWLVAAAFLTAVSIAWYRIPVSSPTTVGLALALCALVSSGTSFVSAFLTRPSRLGSAARLCLPLGLAFVLVAGGDRGPTAWVEGALGVLASAMLIVRARRTRSR